MKATSMVTVREAAERLKVSPAMVYSLCAARILPHARIGRAVRIKEDDLEDYLQGCYRPAPRCKPSNNTSDGGYSLLRAAGYRG